MANLQGFNAQEVEPFEGFEALPEGKYLVAIVESEMEPTKAGDGVYLKLIFEVLEGEYKGRKVWDRLNLDNPSEEAVRIAKAKLSAICRAVGVMTPKDSCELHNLPLHISVKCKKRDDNDDMTNEVKKYEKREPVTQASEPRGEKPSWMRR